MIARTQKQQNKLIFFLLFLFSLFALSIIPIFRIVHIQGLPTGDSAYYHMRLGEFLISSGIPDNDPGLFLKKNYSFDPFDVVLGILGVSISMHYAALILPLLLGILTLFFCYRIFLLLLHSKKHTFLACIFLVTSPIFLTTFSEATDLCFIVFLMTAGLFFFMQHGKKRYFAFLFFGIIGFYEITHSVIAILFIILLGRHLERKKEVIEMSAFLFVFILFSFFLKHTSIQIQFPTIVLFFQTFFSDAGSKFGFSFFALILAAQGIQHICRQRKLPWQILFFCLFILAATVFYSPIYAFYLLPFVTLAGVLGFFSLIDRQWKLAYLRNVTLFLFILGILFSATSVVAKIARAPPSPEIMQALFWLKDHSYENAIVLTGDKYTSWVQYFTERRVLFDKRIIQNKENQALIKEIEALYANRHLETAIEFFEKYQIDYVVIFKEMKEGEIWTNENEGLLFLLQKGENFKKVFENNEVSIWSVEY